MRSLFGFARRSGRVRARAAGSIPLLDPVTTQPKAPPPPRPARRRRRWKRWFVIVTLGLASLTIGLLQTPAAAWLVEPILASQTGMRVRTGSVRISPAGTVVITNGRLLAPGVPGVPGEVLRINRLEARIDWWSTLRGSPGLTKVLLIGPELRLSQDVHTGVLNAAAFKLLSGGGGGRATPSVEIQRGVIELGEHDGERYTRLRRWNILGDIDPADATGVSPFSFAAIPAETSVGGSASGSLSLSGTFGPDGVEANLNGLRLEDWPPTIVPSRLRDLYARLALTGRLLPTRFAIGNDGRVTVRMTLDGVDLNLPFNERYDIAGAGELLRMRQTRGTIEFGTNGLSADIYGLIDELRYDVELNYRGLTPESPFDARMTTRFRMDERFRPRRFLPQKALEKLDMFDNPSADVNALVRVVRAAQGGPVSVDGAAEIRNGSASYAKFRYPFSDIRGTVSFTEDGLRIEGITGRGPSGATLAATGSFDGLGEDSRVVIEIQVRSVPVDQHLMAALTTGRRKLVEALFHPQRYQELLRDGLIRTPDGRGGPNAPLFSFGGAADVDLRLERIPERPEENRWTRDTLVRLDHAGLVPEHFPLPIVARGIQLHIANEDLSLTGGRYEGLTGGEAWVQAEIGQTAVRPGQDPLPVVEITARGIPVDERLLAAIPGYRDPPNPDQPVSLRSILDNLRVAGRVDCRAVIGPRSDGQLGYDVEASLENASARPNADVPGAPRSTPDEPDPLVLDGMNGIIYVTERLIVVDFRGVLQSPARPLAPTPVTLLTQLTLPERRGGLGDVERVGGLLPIEAGPPRPGPGLFATARADGLDLAMPLEHAAAVFSPELADRLAALRAERNPDGVVALRAELDGIVGGHTEIILAVDRVRSLSLDHEGVRHRIGPSRGTMQLSLGVLPHARFSGFRTPIVSGGIDSGEISLDGELPLIPPDDSAWYGTPRVVRVGLRNGRVESPATTQIISAFAGRNVGVWLSDRRVAGFFDLDLGLSPIDNPPPRHGGGADTYSIPALSALGTLRPRSLALDLPSGRIEFNEVEGRVLFEGLGGRVDALRAAAPGLSASIDGPWTFQPEEGAGLDLHIDLAGDRLNESVRTLLPSVLTGVMDRFAIDIQGPISTQDLNLRARGLGTPASVIGITGSTTVSNASAVIGLPVTELSGRIDFAVQIDPDGPAYEINLEADRLRAGRMRIENASAAILADASRPGAVLVPSIVGQLHGGRIAGSAQAHTTGDETRFWVDMHASDVRAAPVFDDLLLPPEGLVGPPLPGEDAVRSAWTVPDDFTRGLLDADVSVAGVTGHPDRTTGRGVVRVAGGSVIALPGLINLVEVSNLRAPMGARLDLAEGEFYIDGTTMAFERLSASSSSIEILGHGTMDWVTQDLNIRFRSRSIRPVPIFSSLLEQIRDELITTRVTGRPGSLDFSTETFGATRRLVRALIGERETEQERIMSAVEQASRAAKNRDPSRESAVVLPASHPETWADQPD